MTTLQETHAFPWTGRGGHELYEQARVMAQARAVTPIWATLPDEEDEALPCRCFRGSANADRQGSLPDPAAVSPDPPRKFPVGRQRTPCSAPQGNHSHVVEEASVCETIAAVEGQRKMQEFPVDSL